MSNILRHLFLWVLMLLPQLSWGQFIWHEDMGSPAVTGRVTLSYDTTSYVFDTVNAEEHSDAGEVWDDLNSQFESAGITWAEIYELGKEESESFTVRLRMEVNTGYGDRYINFGRNGAELVICQQGAPRPEPEPEPEPDPEPEPEPSSPYDTTLNWILTKTYNSDGSSYEDIVYYDGLGYARQSVMINGRGTDDIVKMHSFDVFGRETRDWLPYSRRGNGSFDASAQSGQQAFYKNQYPELSSQSDIRAYAETVYESGSSGRALRQHIQGQEYADTSRSTRTRYRGNGSTDVPILDYVESTGEFVPSGHYAPNTLTGVETVLPSGERQRVWSDLDGRTVMQESCGPDGWVKTLFCYDVRGLLRAVVTPEGVKRLSEGTAYGMKSDLSRGYAYVYEYDGSGRQICRRFPSGAEEYFVYDEGGNVVMRQNGILREKNQWIGIFYDRLGRVTSERLLTDDAGKVQNLALVRSYQDLFDDRSSPSVYSPTGGTLLLENTYDAYPTNLSSSESFSADGLGISNDTRTKSLLTSQRLARITSNGVSSDMCRRVFYYDAYGNILQTIERQNDNANGRVLRHSIVRDLLGNVLTDKQTVIWGRDTDTWQLDYTYDSRGRILTAVGTLNDFIVSNVSYGYDSVGELVSKRFRSEDSNVHEDIQRNLQQWTTNKSSQVFNLSLDYHTSTLLGSTPQYGGRISAQRWEHLEDDNATVSEGGYSYSYDDLGRLTGAGYHSRQPNGWSQQTDVWTEKGLTYTDNGDILTLKRYGAPGSSMHDNLTFTYTGARRNGLQYDANGNLMQDTVRGFTMEYNFLNLPSYISVSEEDYMDYTWYYDGTKVSVKGYEGSYGADYIGSFVYNNDDDGFIRDINFGDGIVRETAEGFYETVYWVTDHLGSPRVAFKLDNSEYASVVERNDYYPFGGRWDDGSGHGGTIAAGGNRYALSGKERQTMSRMGSYLAAHESLLDFGARFYDPATAIFLQQDPLAEKYYNISPYAYCANNPVNFVDPDGRFIGFISDVVSVGMGVRSFAKNISAGNIRGAVWDGVGVVVDLAAAAIPVVPGGVGYVRAGINAADNAIDAAKVIKTGGALAGELNQFEKAAEFGVDSYNALRKNVLDTYGTGSGLEVHHLIEQRFADTMGMKKGDMPSIVLTKEEHKSFTAAWREAIGYCGSGDLIETLTATKDQVLSAAKEIYKDYPELLKTIEEAFK